MHKPANALIIMDELFSINCGNTSDYVFHTANSNLGTKPFLH